MNLSTETTDSVVSTGKYVQYASYDIHHMMPLPNNMFVSAIFSSVTIYQSKLQSKRVIAYGILGKGKF